MAGIGFRFRKMVYEGTYLGELKGYLLASMFAAGPWIMTMLIIGFLTWIAPPEVQDRELIVFRAAITYIYAFSLVFVGLFLLPLTRYLADRLFEENLTAFFSTYMGSLGLTGLVVLIPGAWFMTWNLGSPLFRLFALLIFLVVSLIWISMVFLSCLREYKFIVVAFGLGSLICVVLSSWLKKIWGLEGYMLGYFLGQLIIFSGMTAEIFSEFEYPRGASLTFFRYIWKYPALVLAGLGYNLGIWMDKLVIWNSPLCEEYYGNLRVYGLYDTAVFLAYLSVIPALGYFYANVETSFYEVYRQYFGCIFTKKSLDHLETARDRILYTIDASILNLVKSQGTITLLLFVWADWIAGLLGGGDQVAVIFRLALIGIFFQILFLFCTIFMMYFEFYTELAFVNILFMILNGLLTWMFMTYSSFNLATGYMVTCITVMILTYVILRHKLERLNYITFTGQPILVAGDGGVRMQPVKILGDLGWSPYDAIQRELEFGRSSPLTGSPQPDRPLS